MRSFLVISGLLLLAAAATAQSQSALPAAPSAVQATLELPTAPSVMQEQESRARFRAELEAPPEVPNRLTVGDKFQLFVHHTYSPYTFAAASVSAGISQARGADPGFGNGWRGFSKRYGAALADSESGAFFTKFLIPVLAHQDPRYKRNGREPVGTRLLDALSQIVETEDDDGEPQFNYSQVLGTAVSSSISNIYYPVGSRGFRKTANRTVSRLATEAGMNVVREFLPDIKRAIFGPPQATEREREALSWHTGAQPNLVPARR
jgi:hypothetical protein